ncbi:CobW family GTP-binding protein [Pseudochelatococcus lubricantis]|uniref:CobW family GTP-binding protein n=1 Tax=Pseudochelatococcus lubricantis TaxID=1538102 RepID=UPI0035F02264
MALALPPRSGAGGRIPLHVLTGFLGSGKTTILRRLLQSPEFADTAVIINEFGEIGLDHVLVRDVAEDVVLLSSGCLCCGVRGDLTSTLIDLLEGAASGAIPPFRRIVVETSGLADPGPILGAVVSDRALNVHFAPGVVATAVDAVSGMQSLQGFVEARQQVALASRLLITKTDIADDDGIAVLERTLAGLNPLAPPVRLSMQAAPRFADLFALRPQDDPLPAGSGFSASWTSHSDGIGSFTISLDCPVPRAAFIEWLELLLAARGESILRVKGLLAVTGSDLPHVVQGVQQRVFPLETLPAWPAGATRTGLVFIARDLTRTAIQRSLESRLS